MSSLDTLLRRFGQCTGLKRLATLVVVALAILLVLGMAVGAVAEDKSSEALNRERQARCAAPIGCTPFSYGVSLTWAEGWRPGPYKLTISMDGAAHECTIAVPDAVCADPTKGLQRHRQATQCDLGAFGRVELVDAVRIPPAWPQRPSVVTIPEQDQFEQRLGQLAGCALPGRHALLGIIAFKARLNHVRVSVSKFGRVVGTGEYRPVYQMGKPLGPDCDLVCPRAEGDALEIKP